MSELALHTCRCDGKLAQANAPGYICLATACSWLLLQDDASLMWNEMVRLPGTDFMYKARPANTQKEAPKLPAMPSKIKRAPLETTADGQPVSHCTAYHCHSSWVPVSTATYCDSVRS